MVFFFFYFQKWSLRGPGVDEDPHSIFCDFFHYAIDVSVTNLRHFQQGSYYAVSANKHDKDQFKTKKKNQKQNLLSQSITQLTLTSVGLTAKVPCIYLPLHLLYVCSDLVCCFSVWLKVIISHTLAKFSFYSKTWLNLTYHLRNKRKEFREHLIRALLQYFFSYVRQLRSYILYRTGLSCFDMNYIISQNRQSQYLECSRKDVL